MTPGALSLNERMGQDPSWYFPWNLPAGEVLACIREGPGPVSLPAPPTDPGPAPRVIFQQMPTCWAPGMSRTGSCPSSSVLQQRKVQAKLTGSPWLALHPWLPSAPTPALVAILSPYPLHGVTPADLAADWGLLTQAMPPTEGSFLLCFLCLPPCLLIGQPCK